MGCGASAAKVGDEVYPCLRCQKSTKNGPPNQYCCVECKDGVQAVVSPASATSRRSLGGGALCQRPGCGKPTWDGNPGFCSRSCRSEGSGNLCMRPGCGKPTWNGQPNQFCGRTCQSQHSGNGNNLCLAGCGKPSWNGNPGEYCSKACRAAGPSAQGLAIAADAPLAPGVPQCMNPNCSKPTWNGMPNEFCSNYCRNSAEHPSSCKVLIPGDHRYDDVKKQYETKWDPARGSPTPIRAIYEIVPSTTLFNDFDSTVKSIGYVPTFGNGTNPGNVQRRFHGTRLTCAFGGTCCNDSECSACRIISDGFDMSKLGKWSGNKGHYGGGLYFTSMSSTAKGYGTKPGHSFHKGNWNAPDAGNAILVVKVACGRVETVKDKTDDTVDLDTYDSRKIDKDTGVDELVVFNPKQTLSRYIIVF
mmetsp:Transcript_84779/g.235062  ORF Transcript_84779/g.235062 Transcript_84779/m.235062 type:complete len:416 (-) Transcript_84779:119-1366(-)